MREKRSPAELLRRRFAAPLCFALLLPLLFLCEVEANITKTSPTKSCLTTGCHATASASGAIYTAINGTVRTSATVRAGESFELDWVYTNMVNGGNPIGIYRSSGPLLAVPTGWGVGNGTLNSPAFVTPAWKTQWDLGSGNVATPPASGSNGHWNSSFTDAALPSGTTGYSIDFDISTWDNGTTNEALDDQSAGDADATLQTMGSDATISVPATAVPGTYSVYVYGVGHDGTASNSKSNVAQPLTLTVIPAVIGVSPSTMLQGEGPTTLTINGAGFTASGLGVTFSGSGITAGTPTFVSSTEITVPVSVDPAATPGSRDVTVTASGQSGTGSALFNVTPYHTLTVTVSGSGSGTVTSSPVGISCFTGSPYGCTAGFSVPLTLYATPDWKSLFSGWGLPCSGTGNCDLTMTGDTGVTATFTPNYQATVLGHYLTEYATLQGAYYAARDGSTIAAHVHTFHEDLFFGSDMRVILAMGKGDMYLTQVGYTTLEGSLTISYGMAEISNLIIQ